MKKSACMLIVFLLSIFISQSTDENDCKIPYEPTSKAYHETADKSEIAKLLTDLGLDEAPDDVDKIVYIDYKIPDFPNGIPEYHKPLFGNDIVFRNIESKAALGPLLRSSTFAYPGGSMTVSESVGIVCNLSTPLDAKTISQIGLDVTAKTMVNETQGVSVPNEGGYRTCSAYTDLMRYTFDIYEDGLFSDDFLGTGTIDKPIGVFFVIRTEPTPLPSKD